MTEIETLPPGPFRIGQVSEITGLPSGTIRTWERRYQVVQPRRSQKGTRLYSRQQVHRLQLLKQLTDFGEAVGVLAEMSNADLLQRLSPADAAAGEIAPADRILIVHRTLRTSLSAEKASVHIERCIKDIPKEVSFNVVTIELELLGEDPIASLHKLRDRLQNPHVIVLASFASRPLQGLLEAAGASLMRAPASSEEILKRSISSASSPPPTAPTVASRLTRSFLQRMLDSPVGNACECPQQIARIALYVGSFEEYSIRCIDTNPDDRALHMEMAEAAAEIRMRTEKMLLRVCESDGIRVDDLDTE